MTMLALAGCSERGATAIVVDAGPDAVSDATPTDAPCPRAHLSPCNPSTQTGCSTAQEKCTWLERVEGSSYTGCTPDRSRLAGEACTTVTAKDSSCVAVFTDDCIAGTCCDAGTCRTICDFELSVCASGTSCTVVDGVFFTGGLHLYGLCKAP